MKRDSQGSGAQRTPLSRLSLDLTSVLVLFAALLGVLAAGLRPDAFFAGDPGVKLIAAREALAHPSRPLDVSLPEVAGARLPYLSPFFVPHDGHAHAITSPLFPILTAPALGVFGLRGVYLLPALGFLLAMWGGAAIARALDARRSTPLVALTIGLGTPLIFYGLELWEHAPAVGAGAAALALLLRQRPVAAGMLFGIAVLFRPEALWFGAAAVLVSRTLPTPVRAKSWLQATAGMAMVLAPLEIYSLVHFGSVVPLHVGSNLGNLDVGWWEARGRYFSTWLLRADSASFWRVGPVVLAAVASVFLSARRDGRTFLWAVAALDVLFVIATAPNDGGAQWGPRYMLMAYVPFSILAADLLNAALARGRVGATLVVVALILGAMVQREGYQDLRTTKAIYGRIVDLVRTEVAPRTPAVTDLWWFDQIAAAATADRPVLYASDAATGRAIVQRLEQMAVPSVTVVRSAAESPDTTAWADGTCFSVATRTRLSVRELVTIRLERRCP